MNENMRITFINKLKKNIELSNKSKKIKIFTIATTSKIEKYSYLTPVREINNFLIYGVVLFDEKLIETVISLIENSVNLLLVDSEKKIIYNEKKLNKKTNELSTIEYSGNIFEYIKRLNKKINLKEYKPNDITVNSVWSIISQKFKSISGLKISIIGLGNIGSKLALKLVECGATINVHSQNHAKAKTIINSLNLIKHRNVKAEIKYFESITESCFNVNIIIGCTNGNQIINSDLINKAHNSVFLIDVGKNNLTQDAVSYSNTNNIEIYRADVTAALFGFINEALYCEKIINNSYGKIVIDNITLVGGGMYGMEGAIVVDSIKFPKNIYGISDGNGKLKIDLTKSDKDNIKKIKEKYSIE
jgi:hypothetical protein